MKEQGRIPKEYLKFGPSAELAEYIGVVLGDGNISKFPRSERLIIVANANNPGFINRYALLTEKLFNKKPTVGRVRGTNAVRISIYQKNISERLGIPIGDRSNINFQIPNWILKERTYLVKFLRGLFEAEGSLSIHLPSYTYNFAFSNLNINLLNVVAESLKLLGFHPEVRSTAIRLRKKAEVVGFGELIEFRIY